MLLTTASITAPVAGASGHSTTFPTSTVPVTSASNALATSFMPPSELAAPSPTATVSAALQTTTHRATRVATSSAIASPTATVAASPDAVPAATATFAASTIPATPLATTA